MYIYIYIHICMIYYSNRNRQGINEAQKCPYGEVPLVFVPVGTTGGQPSN